MSVLTKNEYLLTKYFTELKINKSASENLCKELVELLDIGTDVYIWDNEICTLDNIANACGTINYEILSMISSRVPRIYIN